MCSPIDCIISKSQEWCDSAEETESERELEIKSVNSCYPFFVSTILLKILFPGVARECIHSLDPLLRALEGGNIKWKAGGLHTYYYPTTTPLLLEL